MGKIPNVIYAMNESLLDDVEVDEVVDEDSPNVEYKFIFYFNSDKNPKTVMNTFFGSAMDPALKMMKSNGLMDSWDFDMSIGSAVNFPVIGLFMDCMHNNSSSLDENNSFVLSFVVRFPEAEESAEFLGTVSAIMMRYALATGLSMDGNMMESFWRTGIDEELYSVFYDINKRRITSGEKEKWVFHCGKNYDNSAELCKTFAGNFVKTAGKSGIMKPVDDAGTRYVVYSFGRNGGAQRLYLIASDGRCLSNYIVQIDAAANKRFFDNGLMYVDFNGLYKNYMKMDGTLWLSLDYRCGDRFSEGYVPVLRVYSNGSVESNLLDIDRNPLLDEWCFRTEGFVDGLAIVVRKIDGVPAANVVDVNGKLVFDDWYADIRFEDVCDEPDENTKRTVARVRKQHSDIWNYVNRNGKVLLSEWLDRHCGLMVNGFAKVCKHEGKRELFNYMREDGSLVLKEWFDKVCGWPECGMVAIKNNDGQWQFIDTDTGDAMFGGCVFGRIDDSVGVDGFKYYDVRTVEEHGDDKKMYCDLVSSDGRMCCENMDMLNLQYVGSGLVLASKSFFSNKELWKFGDGPVKFGRVVSHACRLGDSEYTVVTSVDKYTIVDKNGNPVCDDWFDRIGDNICGGFVEVWSYGDDHKSARMNVLACKTGKLMFGTDDEVTGRICGAVPDELVVVEKTGNYKHFLYNIFDASGKQMLGEWTRFCIRPVSEGILMVGPSAYVDYSGKPVAFV